MDDLLNEFLTETTEALDVVDAELVRFESDPNDKDILDKIFRLVHTIKGTCGFLGLPRLESVAHAGETMLGKFRDGELTVTPTAVTLVLEALDQIKVILCHLEDEGSEPEGDDAALIDKLNAFSAGGAPEASAATLEEVFENTARDDDEAEAEAEEATSAEDAPAEEDAPVAEEEHQEAAPKEAAPKEVETAAASADDALKGKEPSIASQSIRVNVDVIENLMTMVSELVLTRNQLLEMVRHMDDSEFEVPLQRLSNVTGELQEGVMKTRMQPVGNAWQKLPRVVRDLGQELGKKMVLDMQGADTELDRQVLELIKDPLTHMVRNSADHGLETPGERKAAGKSETGRILLKAFHEGGHIVIEITDDGRGLNMEKIKEKILANGLATSTQLETMSEGQIQRFVLNAGFSTAQKVTNVSGRGVGMDVVRSNIELIGGTIDLRSKEGEGSTFTIKIPLTLVIVSALIVSSGGQKFAIPQLTVVELVRTGGNSETKIEHVNKTPVLRLRDRLLPLIYLTDELGLGDAESDNKGTDGYIVVAQVGDQTFGVVMDEVFDTEEIVVKPASSVLRDITMFSGNTILGDGSVIMIIDPNGLAATVSKEQIEEKSDAAADDDAVGTRAAEETTSLLIFRAGNQEPKAVPLSVVTRLEEVDAAKIETASGEAVTQYRGTLMPLIHSTIGTVLKAEGRQPMLVFSDGGRQVGIAVDQIVDVVEDRLEVELEATRPGVLGTAIIRGKATELMDVGHYLTQVYPDWFDRNEESMNEQQKPQVLLVDDSAFFRNMMSPLLKVAGYSVTVAESVEQAWAYRESGVKFDAIISDIEMPDVDGWAFAERVRDDVEWGGTPILALTSCNSPEDLARSQEVGFVDHVSKTDRNRIVSVLEHTLSHKEEAA